MAQKQTIDAMWDDSPIDVSTEVNFIWSIANKLRGTYQSDKYKDVTGTDQGQGGGTVQSKPELSGKGNVSYFWISVLQYQ